MTRKLATIQKIGNYSGPYIVGALLGLDWGVTVSVWVRGNSHYGE